MRDQVGRQRYLFMSSSGCDGIFRVYRACCMTHPSSRLSERRVVTPRIGRRPWCARAVCPAFTERGHISAACCMLYDPAVIQNERVQSGCGMAAAGQQMAGQRSCAVFCRCLAAVRRLIKVAGRTVVICERPAAPPRRDTTRVASP